MKHLSLYFAAASAMFLLAGATAAFYGLHLLFVTLLLTVSYLSGALSIQQKSESEKTPQSHD
jgi:hypothetical protein